MNERFKIFPRIIDLLARFIFAIGLFIYLPAALVGAGWVLGDLFESEGLTKELGYLIAIFLPFYLIWFFQHKE